MHSCGRGPNGVGTVAVAAWAGAATKVRQTMASITLSGCAVQWQPRLYLALATVCQRSLESAPSAHSGIAVARIRRAAARIMARIYRKLHGAWLNENASS